MLTKEQKKWINHLSNEDKIKIVPFDPEVKRVFKVAKQEIRRVLGPVRVSHRGSTALGISGQGEIDLYVPVTIKDFNATEKKLSKHLGKPGSLYPLERVRYVKYFGKTKVEIFIINKNNPGWKNSIVFEQALRKDPRLLRKYEILKSKCDSKSIRYYYTKKVEFINYILSLN